MEPLVCLRYDAGRRKWQPTPVLLSGKLHGWRSLIGYSPWGHKELDTTERLHFLSLSCIASHQGSLFMIKVKVKSLSHVRLFVTPWTVAYQAPPSMGFSRQECWSGLLFPSPGDFPYPGIEPGSPALQADALPSEPPGKLHAELMSKQTWRNACIGEKGNSVKSSTEDVNILLDDGWCSHSLKLEQDATG